MTVTRRSVPTAEPVSICDEPLPGSAAAASDLADRLQPWAEDRELCSRDLVLATAREVCDWTLDWPTDWDALRIGGELERGFSTWAADHAWRGPCAQFLDALRRTWWGYRDHGRDELQGIFAEEVGLWLWSIEEGLEAFGEHDVAWNGEPLSRGRRLPLRREAARHAAETLGKGEIVLVTAWSETLALALELAWKAGKKPHLLMGESLPWLDGRRMARRVVPEGVRVTLVYDAALPRELARADRVWTPAEAIGASAFTTRIGTRTLLEAAHAEQIPVELVTTSDKVVPGGALSLPRWCRRSPDLLWEDAIEGVTLELDCYEPVPLELTPQPITEVGRERVADLSLRALRADTELPCGATDRARL